MAGSERVIPPSTKKWLTALHVMLRRIIRGECDALASGMSISEFMITHYSSDDCPAKAGLADHV